MIKRLFSFAVAVVFCAAVAAQEAINFLPLYPDGAPGSNGLKAGVEERKGEYLAQAADADYALFLPDKSKATGQGIVICPGGSYHGVAYLSEGIMVARWMQEQGVAALVLRYRMPNGNKDIPLADVHAAIKLMRRNAPKWNVDPDNVGIIGFSAGGHLASTATVRYDGDTRPDFSILVYPVISFDEKYTHHGTRRNLIGREYNAELIEHYSNHRQVSSDTPRTLILYSDDDNVVQPVNGVFFYEAMHDMGRPVEMHIYPSGGHGWGWKPDFKYHDEMTRTVARWLKDN